jgi:hypothetical protein
LVLVYGVRDIGSFASGGAARTTLILEGIGMCWVESFLNGAGTRSGRMRE